MIRRIIRYTAHLFHIRHRRGRGIHSPYLFEFVHEILFNARGTGTPEGILRIHRELGRDWTLIPQERWLYRAARAPLPAGSESAAGERSVRSFVRRSSVPPRYGALLYRIARWFRPDMLLELGTGLGVSTLYLASGAPGVPLHSVEGHTERAAFAASLLCRCGLEQVSIHWGEMDEKLDGILMQMPGRFLAFIDGNHRYEPTVRYVRKLLSVAGEEAVIVMDDICWSPEMEKAWREVTMWPEVRASVDLFRFGILFLRKDLQKMHFKINF
ncbi:MAG TPA: class I SAM-dependent methyltransferase [Bacteroides sp.]|nr:class I SAM-dependent methyltransferase [Bacteroides sp.]